MIFFFDEVSIGS